MMSNNIFVLTYSSITEFFKHTIPVKNSTYHIIDNGNQKYTPTFGCNYYSCSSNIGCAGGWNLICDIAFDYLSLDKIVITQDDVVLSPDIITELFNTTSGLTITGAIQPFFEFSTFCITKQVWNKVGRFDENFIYVYSEDADYKQRCMISGVQVESLFIPNKNINKSASIKNNPLINRIEYNRAYLQEKWGVSVHPSIIARDDYQPPFKYKTPFSELLPIDYIPHTTRIKNVYGNNEDTPSAVEYKLWKQNGYT